MTLAAQTARSRTLIDPAPRTRRQVERSANFRRWFAGSKVVDLEGRPLVVYHGTPSSAEHANNPYVRSEGGSEIWPFFDIFQTTGGGYTDALWLGEGAYFTPDPEYAWEFGDRIVPAYLRVLNPFYVYNDGSNTAANHFRLLRSLQGLTGLPEKLKLDLAVPPPRQFESQTQSYFLGGHTKDGKYIHTLLSTWADLPGAGGIIEGRGASPEEAIFDYRYRDRFCGFLLHTIVHQIGPQEFRRLIESNGYDGVIEMRTYWPERDDWEIKEVVAFSPAQIKSATGNSGTFSASDPDFCH